MLVGRLKPGLDLPEAEARLQALVPRLKDSAPGRWKDDSQLYLDRLARLSHGGRKRLR